MWVKNAKSEINYEDIVEIVICFLLRFNNVLISFIIIFYDKNFLYKTARFMLKK